MDELGIIINQKGEVMKFGKWKPRKERDKNNPFDWHNDSFMLEIYNTEWFKELGVYYDTNINFQNQLDIFAEYGVIVLVNCKEDSQKVGESRVAGYIPTSITDEQIEVLDNMRENLIKFGNGHYAYIDILDNYSDKDYDIIKSFHNLEDFYNYFDEFKEKRISIHK